MIKKEITNIFLLSCLNIPRCSADKTAGQNMHNSELIKRLYVRGSSQLSFGCIKVGEGSRLSFIPIS